MMVQVNPTTDAPIVLAADQRLANTSTSEIFSIPTLIYQEETPLTSAPPFHSGSTETVHTFPYYLSTAANLFVSKGAHVLISSQTPNNPDESGIFTSSPSRFVNLAKTAATMAKVDYVDHSAYSYAAYKSLSVKTVDGYFPNDHTHTAPKGADLVARAFVKGLVCGGSLLGNYVKNATSAIEGACLE
jgi:rhamnogalacturonan acetylesterase